VSIIVRVCPVKSFFRVELLPVLAYVFFHKSVFLVSVEVSIVSLRKIVVLELRILEIFGILLLNRDTLVVGNDGNLVAVVIKNIEFLDVLCVYIDFYLEIVIKFFKFCLHLYFYVWH
jgi:hypothetical protein